MSKLKIKNLHAQVDGLEILKGVNLELGTGEVHAIMGPNGTGKSTLASVIMGNPIYEVTKGEIFLDDKDVLEMEVYERSRNGIFLAMQYPAEVTGVTNYEFINTALRSHRGEEKISVFKVFKEYEAAIKELKMASSLAHRYLNEGFSGGEKKRNEILQMKMLKPKIAILDEIDSGLDIDNVKIVGEAVNEMVSENFGCLLITHYQRILDYIKPTHVHIMIDGKIVKSGGIELIEKIEKQGYEWLKKDLNIDFEVR
ncbi:MAG TPA: Fe-S cluster assembly ATPase SufC [Acholeplasma sp.]|nr:Fe-S cluster assembly ATPase SufC [Acholeplasma sp.]